MKYLCAMAALWLSLTIAATPVRAQAQYPNGYQAQPQGYHGVLSAEDQQQFDKYYSKWMDASRKGDQDDISGNARHMQDIMARYNIPPNVPFDVVASNSGYPQGQVYGQAVPQAAPPYGAPARLSPDDQQRFDKAYSKWLDASRKGDRDDINDNVRTMQEIMARYNIPLNTPFQAVSTNGYAAGQPAYGYANNQGPQRLSADDQKKFDKAYHDWVNARRKKDMDGVDKNAHKMEDIMAHYNIPANVPFDQIASAGSAYH